MNYLAMEARAREARQDFWMCLIVGLFAVAMFTGGWWMGATEATKSKCAFLCAADETVVVRPADKLLDASEWTCFCGR